jgi:sec-independent protein translocase protein TatA
MQMIALALSTHPILAFGIPSGPDLIILLVIVLVLFGAKRLPELARGFGQSVNEFKKAKDEFDKEVAKPTSVPSTPGSAAVESNPTTTTSIKDEQKPV